MMIGLFNYRSIQDPSVTQRLEDVAEQRGLTLQQIAEQIIETVAKDDLFKAVLGD